MKRIITLCLVFAFTISLPVVSHAYNAVEIIEPEYQAVTVSANNSKLHIVGANNLVVEIYNVAGVRIMSIRVDGHDKYYDLNLPKGCYIVKVGKVVRKISIR